MIAKQNAQMLEQIMNMSGQHKIAMQATATAIDISAEAQLQTKRANLKRDELQDELLVIVRDRALSLHKSMVKFYEIVKQL